MSYKLIDFGDGKKLEQFDNLKIIRPSIYAENISPSLQNWQADLEFILIDGKKGKWIGEKLNQNFENEYFTHSNLKYKLDFNEYGNLGVFPEHLNNLWLMDFFSNQSNLSILNLFSYSGTNILSVLNTNNFFTHVDSSKNAIKLLKQNIDLNKIETNSRFIIEDVIKFLQKEMKRNKKYDVIILDPPTFGRGSKSEIFKLTEDINKLLELLKNLKSSKFSLLLFTHHTDEIENDELKRNIEFLMNVEVQYLNSYIIDSFGKKLPSGYILKYVKRA